MIAFTASGMTRTIRSSVWTIGELAGSRRLPGVSSRPLAGSAPAFPPAVPVASVVAGAGAALPAGGAGGGRGGGARGGGGRESGRAGEARRASGRRAAGPRRSGGTPPAGRRVGPARAALERATAGGALGRERCAGGGRLGRRRRLGSRGGAAGRRARRRRRGGRLCGLLRHGHGRLGVPATVALPVSVRVPVGVATPVRLAGPCRRRGRSGRGLGGGGRGRRDRGGRLGLCCVRVAVPVAMAVPMGVPTTVSVPVLLASRAVRPLRGIGLLPAGSRDGGEGEGQQGECCERMQPPAGPVRGTAHVSVIGVPGRANQRAGPGRYECPRSYPAALRREQHGMRPVGDPETAVEVVDVAAHGA